MFVLPQCMGTEDDFPQCILLTKTTSFLLFCSFISFIAMPLGSEPFIDFTIASYYPISLKCMKLASLGSHRPIKKYG